MGIDETDVSGTPSQTLLQEEIFARTSIPMEPSQIVTLE